MIAGLLLVGAVMTQDPSVEPKSPACCQTLKDYPEWRPDALLWAAFLLDHSEWPKRREVGISRTGLVVTLEWSSQTRARLSTFSIEGSEVDRLFRLVHSDVRFCRILYEHLGGAWVPTKLDHYYLYGVFGHVGAHSPAHCPAYEIDAVRVEPLMRELRALLARAARLWRPTQAGKDPPLGGYLETDNISFLFRFLDHLHRNDAYATGTGVPVVKRSGRGRRTTR